MRTFASSRNGNTGMNARASGAVAYMEKPIDSEMIAERMEDLSAD